MSDEKKVGWLPGFPVPWVLCCPQCQVKHVDEGEWATTRVHRTHLCQNCKHEWRPFRFPTVGVSQLGPQTNEQLLDLWKLLWREFGFHPSINDDKIKDAVFSYTARSLGRRKRVPDIRLVLETANGKPVPACGYIDCFCDYEHVH